MDARPVDERDSQWESRTIAARVIFGGSVTEAVDLDDTDIASVVAWAEAQSRGPYELWIRTYNQIGQPGLILAAIGEDSPPPPSA